MSRRPRVPAAEDTVTRAGQAGRWVFVVVMLLAVILIGAGNLAATYGLWTHFEGQYQAQQRTNAQQAAQQQAVQQRQGRAEEAALCDTFGKLAALKPPSGNAQSNPSRAYDQRMHDILAGVVRDIRCPR
jgi:uncharacterized protein HemX